MELQLEQSLISEYGPSDPEVLTRLRVLNVIKKAISETFPEVPLQIGEYGSFPLRTFLKAGDVDITLIIKEPPIPDFPLYVLTRLRQFLTAASNPTFQDILLINSEVPILKLKVNKISVDISINQYNSIKVVHLFQELNKAIGNDLLKRSFIIVKIWATYFGRILGGMYGGLTTYALEILVLFIINTIPESRGSPLRVLQEFIEFFSSFDWENNVITFCKAIPVTEYVSIITHKQDLFKNTRNLLISPQYMTQLQLKLKISTEKSLMPLRFLNILDPFDSSNNLGRSVNANSLSRIKDVFRISAENIDFTIKSMVAKRNPLPEPQIVMTSASPSVLCISNKKKNSQNIENSEIFNVTCKKSRENFKKSFKELLENTHKNRIRAK